MATTSKEHLDKAAENIAFRKTLDLSTDTGMGWYVTVTFYAALHYVEAYLVDRGKGSKNHHSRATAIQKDGFLGVLYGEYRDLENLSREARYDIASFKNEDLKCIDLSLDKIRQSIEAVIRKGLDNE